MDSLPEKIRQKLKSSEYWTQKTKENSDYIQGLKCPDCGRDAWAYAAKPFIIICNHLNNCGAMIKTLALFPELTQKIEQEYKPTQTEPDRPATEYLRSRGLNGSLDGLLYKYWANVRNTGSGAAMFEVAEGVWNGRLFNPPDGEGKTHNKGSTRGLWWQHPVRDYSKVDTVYVTEAILDALSLIEMGRPAISVLSAGSDPASINLPFKNITLAFDPDEAGKRATRKWKKVFPDAEVMVPPASQDWNDLLLNHLDDPAQAFTEEAVKDMAIRGRLTLAESGQEYAKIYVECYGRAPGLFVFDGCYFHAYQKNDKDETLVCTRASDFITNVVHIIKSETVPDLPENKYKLAVKPLTGGRIYFTASAEELSSSDQLLKLFLKRSRVLWRGNRYAGLALVERLLRQKAPVVRNMETIGYDDVSRVYVFRDFAVKGDGSIIRPDASGIFKLSGSELIRPAQLPCLKPSGGMTAAEIYSLIHTAFPGKAEIIIPWMVASWFITQIRGSIGFFPFLSLWGEVQSGKTTVVRILNNLQSLDEEGIQMTRQNTAKGELRKFSQYGGLFRALLEGRPGMRFDLNQILTLYNGPVIYSRAEKNLDNTTRDLLCHSGLVFVQNAELFTEKAQRERVIALHFEKDAITNETYAALREISALGPGKLAHFLVEVMRQRRTIEAGWRDLWDKHQRELTDKIKDGRIAGNYAIVLTFYELLAGLLKTEADITEAIEVMARKRVADCAKREMTVADEFLHTMLAINPEDPEAQACIRVDAGKLYFRLGPARKFLETNICPLRVQDNILIDALRNHPGYLWNNRTFRFWVGQTTESQKAWAFDLDAIVGDGNSEC